MPGRVRREIRLRGVVQGIGFRPWAARQARALALAGEVQNAGWGVRVDLEGDPQAVSRWLEALAEQPPAGARIDALEVAEAPWRGSRGFAIAASAAAASGSPTRIPPDLPLCEACRDELFDPRGRRHRYAFTHCAHCGPRASVLLGLPYDRERTTLRSFPPCGACAREYADPADRRFHAESIACPACGPRLSAFGADGRGVDGEPIEAAAACIREGGIVALKGYGGFHLLCDATRPEAIARLRRRKARPVKPFAVLVPDLDAARARACLRRGDEAWLGGAPHAVVVAPRRDACAVARDLARGVAPRTRDLGLVLPVAPAHWLLLFAPGTRPGADAPRFDALVFTSANLRDEPTLHDDAEARARLGELADLVVGHDRAVARPNDDPVVRTRSGEEGPLPVRLSRSVAPLTLPVSGAREDTPVVLAVGGDLKAAPALLARGELVIGEHVGDLASVDAADALEERAAALCRLLEARPALVAHDLHPGYLGTAIAERIARRLGARTVAVQHHHAHAAACLVEHRRSDAVLALVLDGGGWGGDGTIWGGELLRVEPGRAERLARIEPVPLPGGEAAIREPWRMAWAWLRQAFPEGDGPPLPGARGPGARARALVARAAERGVASPPTSSCGRLFDAVACLLGLGDRVSHEGELAVALEGLAESAPPSPLSDRVEASAPPAALEGRSRAAPPAPPADPVEASAPPDPIVRVAPLVRALVQDRARGEAPALLARRFHHELAARLAAAAAVASRSTGLQRVAVTGGCLQNRLLAADLETQLERRGLSVLRHRRLPPNDGGLAAGQAWVASRLRG